MIIKISKIISCSSENPSYPASNLLEHPPKSSWRCAKPNELIATVILQLAESSSITGLEIGNYRACIVVIEASTSEEPDKWVPIINHQFLSHDEAANNKFRDQVQIFTKRELNPETVKIKFDRVKITCMQSANPRELFGLESIILRTEVAVDFGLDVFGRFKLKEKNDGNTDEFKDKYLKLFGNKINYKEQLKNEITKINVSTFTKKQEENQEPKKRPYLDKLEADAEVKKMKPGSSKTNDFKTQNNSTIGKNQDSLPIQQILFEDTTSSPKTSTKIKKNAEINDKKCSRCSDCLLNIDNLCSTCQLLSKPRLPVKEFKTSPVKIIKPKKEFIKLFEDIKFSLSGYVNPQRDEIRRKALKMGAKYIADPNLTHNKCTHLVCAFKNTPKYQQFKSHCKIVSHKFIEDCFDKKKRLPWRRYALDSKEKSQPESEEEIEGTTSPIQILSVYDQETDDSE